MDIARRSVTTYREAMNIPSCVQCGRERQNPELDQERPRLHMRDASCNIICRIQVLAGSVL
ncbi:hypothetical protein GNX16_08990 [Mesorhizobium japonicum]|nr:hypothetical protein [Mesorhizobium japonicum]